MCIGRSSSLAFAGVAMVAIAGCASVDVRRVADSNQSGIRYWRPAPYFALSPLTSGKQTTCQATLVMLPDKTEEYAINANTGLWGTAEADPTLQDGWNLTSMTGKADSKTAETLTAFSAVIKSLPASVLAKGPPEKGNANPEPTITRKCSGLIRLDYDPSILNELVGFSKMNLPVDFAYAPAPKGDGSAGGKPK